MNFCNLRYKNWIHTAKFMKKVPSVYTYLMKTICLSLVHTGNYSRCSFSVLLGWANAIKVRANAIKIPDQHFGSTNGFLLPIKCLEWVLKYSYLVSIILNYQFPKQCLRIFFVLILDFNSISSHSNSISLHFNSISSHFNSINSSQ